MTTEAIPVITLSPFLRLGVTDHTQQECTLLARTMCRLGLAIVIDHRALGPSKNVARDFFEMTRLFFAQPVAEKRRWERPGHQQGWTPSFTEKPRPRPWTLSRLAEDQQPHPLNPLGDPKERFFTRFGLTPPDTKFPDLNGSPEDAPVPDNFPRWKEVSDAWGTLMHQAVYTVAEMLAIGIGLQRDYFTQLMHLAPNLVAPTGANLDLYGTPGTVLAGVHDDLNLLTIHAAANTPGLFCWTRDGQRMAVRLPPGHFLVQGGQQAAYATGGFLHAGLHEVVAVPEMKSYIDQAHSEGKVPWRISGTYFAHAASDLDLAPREHLATDATLVRYPSLLAGEHVRREIRAIGIA